MSRPRPRRSSGHSNGPGSPRGCARPSPGAQDALGTTGCPASEASPSSPSWTGALAPRPKVPVAEGSIRVPRPEAVVMKLRIAHPPAPGGEAACEETRTLPADLAFAGAPWAWVGAARPLVTRDSGITPRDPGGAAPRRVLLPLRRRGRGRPGDPERALRRGGTARRAPAARLRGRGPPSHHRRSGRPRAALAAPHRPAGGHHRVRRTGFRRLRPRAGLTPVRLRSLIPPSLAKEDRP